MKIKLLFLIFLMSTSFAMSQSKSFWQKQSINNNLRVKPSKQNLPTTQTFTLNTEGLIQALIKTPQRGNLSSSSNVILSFPNDQGEFERFRIFEASVMDSELAARYPEIKSYAGQGIDDPTAIIRFSVTPLGFQSIRFSANRPASFIEAITDDASVYSVFTRGNKINMNNDFECSVTESMNTAMNTNDGMSMRNADDSLLRTYRLAVSATGEYTNYHGGTKALALAAIVQTMTRVNGIFEIDFNVTMVLINNTDDVIYTSTNSDPYGNTTSNYNSQLQSTLTNVIGESNYDIGHLFANLQNNGNAGCIGCVCVNGQKGSGWTSATIPEGEPFDVDYVAHEIGHQFGANHTWTFGGNEGTNAQMEPGSGSTIMGYAGITGATDVQSNSDPYFHAISIEQVTDYIKTTSCQTNTNTGNAVPLVNAGSNYTIPRGTPFVLDGSATDSDSGDVLTYCWEQIDENNAASTLPNVNSTTGVAFRSFNPTTDTQRYFPRLSTVKTGATSWQWEAVPNVARNLNFRLTVRDNRAGGATNNSDDMVVTVNNTAGPFVVNSPNTNVTWNAGTTQTVTWNVAGTTGNGVNATNVDIFLSTDGGNTYPISLASGVPNDGAHDILVPNNQGNQNRIMVRGANNIFFDISNSNFTIGAPVICNTTVPTGLSVSNLAETSATLSWDAVPGASYDLRYREVGASTWNTFNVNVASTLLSGLTVLTQYEAQVRSECPDTSTSAFSSSVNFTTTNICTPTTSNFNSNTLNHSGTGSTGTTLSFTGGVHEDVTFIITELNARTGGKQNRRFIDQVVVTYVDGNGISQNFGTFSGNATSSVNVSILGITQSVTVALSDAFDGNAGSNMSIILSSVQSCVTLNCTDSDGDGVCDEDDQCPSLDDNLIGASCDDGDPCTINDVYGPDCGCAGTFADSDGDGVCDGDDICPGGDDTIDLNGNGVPDDCDCASGSGSFNPSTLNHSGGGSNAVSFSFSSLSKDVSFNITGLDARVNGNPRNRFEELATVTFVDANGQTQTFNSYSGANQTTANVTISDFISEVTVSLSNGVSGSSTSLSISLSNIDFCEQNSGAIAKEANSLVDDLSSNAQIKDITVFPNPAKSELNIRFVLNTTNDDVIDVNLKIYDLTGKIIKRVNWSRLSNPIFERQIDISSLENGIYLIGLESSNGARGYSKLIKK